MKNSICSAQIDKIQEIEDCLISPRIVANLGSMSENEEVDTDKVLDAVVHLRRAKKAIGEAFRSE